jgi:hypothetical protein
LRIRHPEPNGSRWATAPSLIQQWPGQSPIENGTAIVLTYVLVSMGVIIAFLLAAFVIGSFIGRLRQRRREQIGDE